MRTLLVLSIACTLACTGGSDPTDTNDLPNDSDIDTDTVPSGPIDIYGGGPFNCDVIPTSELTSSSASLHTAVINLNGEPERSDLSVGGQEVYDDGNLNGNSINSEILAHEVLFQCDGAELIYTEGEVPYEDAQGKKTDLVVTLDGERIGVSVTRAVGYPPEDPWGVDKATALLEDKLADIPISSDNVVDSEAWKKQVLFVAAYSDEHVESLQTAWPAISADTKSDTIVVIARTDGDDTFIYFRR